MEENTLLMPFLDGSETYTLGFEAGQIWVKLESGEVLENYLFHTKNIKQVELIMKSFLSDFDIEVTNEDWSLLNMKRMEI